MKFPLIITICVVLSAAASAQGQSAFAPRGEKVYETTCVVCHAAGISGAPRVGDKSAWAERIAKGKDSLVLSALKGKGLMPPKGSNPKFNDEDIRSAVEYMVGASR